MNKQNTKKIITIIFTSFFLFQGVAFAFAAFPPVGNDPEIISPIGNDPVEDPVTGNDPVVEPVTGNDPVVEPVTGNDPEAPSLSGFKLNPPKGNDPENVPPKGNDPETIPPKGNDPETIPPKGNDPEVIPPKGNDPEPEVTPPTPPKKPTVDIKANNSDGPITISYNTAATLSWVSTNATSCVASESWSGNKSINGSESTGNLTASKTYTITCTGPGGKASDSVTVNVSPAPSTPGSSSSGKSYASSSGSSSAKLYVKKTVKNVTQNTDYVESVFAKPGDILSFGIVVKAGGRSIYNVIVKDTLSEKFIYKGDLRVDNVLISGNIQNGLDIGMIEADDMKTVTFLVEVQSPESFNFGQNKLTNTALVSSEGISVSDEAGITVEKSLVAGAATNVPTGLTNNIFLDSFLVPLVLAGLIFWLLKSHIIKYEEWLDKRKKQYKEYKSEKSLRSQINKIKVKEFFKRNLTF